MKPLALTNHLMKPKSFEEAKEVPKWQASMKAEYPATCSAACELIVDKTLKLMYCSTNVKVVDGFTIAFSRTQMEHLIWRKGVGPPLGH